MVRLQVIISEYLNQIIQLSKQSMSARKPWSDEEDRVLKHLRDTTTNKKWSQIALQMHDDYKMPKRSGKQCSERYYYHLDPTKCKQDWTLQEQQKLFEYHNQYGNQWSLIGRMLNGRTDNCIKNKFYSKLKKTLRRLNNAIKRFMGKGYGEIQQKTLYRIMEASQDSFQEQQILSEEFSHFSKNLKTSLQAISFSEAQFTKDQIPAIEQIVLNISLFNKGFKRKRKTVKKSTHQRHLSYLQVLAPKNDPFQPPQQSESMSEDVVESEIPETEAKDSESVQLSGQAIREEVERQYEYFFPFARILNEETPVLKEWEQFEQVSSNNDIFGDDLLNF